MIEYELRMGTKQSEITQIIEKLLSQRQIEQSESFVGKRTRQLTSAIQGLVQEVAAARQERIDERNRGEEVSNGAIEVGREFSATVTRMAVGRFCMVRTQNGGHSVSVHVDWNDTNNVHVSQGSPVQVRIKGLPSGEHTSYSGELVKV